MNMNKEFIRQNATASGSCRENFRWYFLDGELYIEGTGALDYLEDWSYFYDSPVGEYWKRNKPVLHPWKELIRQIRHIEIDEGCRELGLGAFENHSNLETVTLPESLEKIGLFAFGGCVRLEHIVVPRQLKEIDDYAFNGCITLKSLVIPENVAQIGIGAFTAVERISYSGSLESENNWGARSRTAGII